MEILDWYPQTKTEVKSIPYLQGIEKIAIPEIDLFIIELKGDHINSLMNGPIYESRDQKHIYTNKRLNIMDLEIQNALFGHGLFKRWKDYTTQTLILNVRNVYHFTLTEGTGKRRYLTSLIFYELAIDSSNKRAYLIPMVYTLISSYPVFGFQKQYLEALFNDWVRNLNRRLFNDIPKLFKQVVSDETKLSYSYGIVAKRLSFFTSFMFHCLKAGFTGEMINIYKMSPSKHSLMKFENSITSSKHFKIDNFDFSLLFKKIKIKTLMQLYAAILLERKVIIVTNNVSINAVVIEILLTLLYPMKWDLLLVANVTMKTSAFVDAPFPYIIGTSQKEWAEIYPYKWEGLPEDIFVVNIETNKIQIKEPLPPLPPTFSGVLESTLEQHLAKQKIFKRSSYTSEEIEQFWIKTSMNIKQEFLYFLIFLMNDFVECFKNCNNKDLNAPSLNWIEDIFKYEKYLKNIHKSSDFSPEFTSRFIHTQLFTQMIEHYYTPDTQNNSSSGDVFANQTNYRRMAYFKKLLKEFEKGGLRGLRNMQKSEINIVLDDYLHPNNISIEQAYWYYTDLISNKAHKDEVFRN